VTILIAYFVPVSALLIESRPRSSSRAPSSLLCGPVLFASILFIRMFAATSFRGSALGSNLLGALVGGLLESLSMWIGLRALLFLAVLLYAAAYFASHRKQRARASSEVEVLQSA